MAHVTIQNVLLDEVSIRVVESQSVDVGAFVTVELAFTGADGRTADTVQAFVALDLVQLSNWAELLRAAANGLDMLQARVIRDTEALGVTS